MEVSRLTKVGSRLKGILIHPLSWLSIGIIAGLTDSMFNHTWEDIQWHTIKFLACYFKTDICNTDHYTYFNGQYYFHWKDRSKIFVSSNDQQAWIVIKKGPNPIPVLTEMPFDPKWFDITKEK